ncbi:MAG: pilus assembly protein PilM, partial [Planctomycetota bacterium]
MSNKGIGLELSFTRLKLVVLEVKKDGVMIVNYDTENVDKGATVEDSIQNLNVAVNTILKRNKISGSLGISFPSHAIFNRQVKLLPQPDDELYKTLSFEINEYLPFPANEAIWSYHKVIRDYNPGEEFDIIVVAGKYELMEQIEQILGPLIYKADVLQFAPLALYSYLRYEYADKKETYLVLDIGELNNDMIVIEEGKFWHRSLNLSGKDVTKAIVTKLGVSEQEAHQLKMGEMTPQLLQAITPFVKNLSTEINRSINFYKYTSKKAIVSEIKLCGSTSKLKNLTKMLQESSLIKTVCMDMPEKLYIHPSIEQNIITDIASLYPAIGLALQAANLSELSMNFTPHYVIEYKQISKKKPLTVVGVLLVIIAILVANFSFSKKTDELTRQVDKMKETVSKHEQWLKEYNNIKTNLNRRYFLNFLSKLYDVKDKPLYILDYLVYEIKKYNTGVGKDEKIYLVGFDYSIVPPEIKPRDDTKQVSSKTRPGGASLPESKKEEPLQSTETSGSVSHKKVDDSMAKKFIRHKEPKYKLTVILSTQLDMGGYTETEKGGVEKKGPFTTIKEKLTASDPSPFVGKFVEILKRDLGDKSVCIQWFKAGSNEPRKCPVPKYMCSEPEST